MTLAKDHFDRSMLSSSIVTMSPIFMFWQSFVHFFHVSNGKYSFIQRFQYILVTASTDFHSTTVNVLFL